MNTLDLILGIIGTAAAAAQPFVAGNPTGAATDALAQQLIKIAQAASAAHQQVTGRPIDLSLLQPIDPLP